MSAPDYLVKVPRKLNAAPQYVEANVGEELAALRQQIATLEEALKEIATIEDCPRWRMTLIAKAALATATTEKESK